MPSLVKQSTTQLALKFFMTLSSDHITGATGLSPTVTIRKEGGSFASPSGAVTEIAHGWYQVAGNATDTNTLGEILLHATAATADPCDMIAAEVVAFDPQDAVRAGLTALPNAAAGANTGLPVVGTQVPNATAGTANGLLIAGSNAATTFASLTVTTTTTLTGAVSLGSTLGVTGTTTLAALNTGAVGTGNVTITGTLSTSGTTTLNALTVTNATTLTGNVSMAAGLNITQSASNTTALVITGNGTGNGATITSGSGATGVGLSVVSAATNGTAIRAEGTGIGSGLGLVKGSSGSGLAVDTVAVSSTLIVGGATTFIGAVTGTNAANDLRINGAVPGAAGGLFVAGTNAATTITTALTTTFTGNLTGNIGGNVVGTVASVVGDIGGLAAGAITDVEDAVWDAVLANHLDSGSTGAALNAAGSAGDPWGTALPGAYGAGTAGHIVGTALPDIAPGSTNGLLRGGTNAATTFATLTSTGAFSINGVSNVAQTGDSFARIGAAGAGLTDLAPSATALSSATWTNGLATNIATTNSTVATNLDATVSSRAPSATALSTAVWTNTLATNIGTTNTTVAGNLDATITSRMATYVQPTGFLAATFPAGTITNNTTEPDWYDGPITPAAIATAVWQDTTAGDFTVASSIGKSLYTAGATPGASGGLLIAGSNAAATFSSLTSSGAFTVGSIVNDGVTDVAQTGDSFALIGTAGAGLTAVSLTAAAYTAAADALIARNIAGGSSTGRTVGQAFAVLRNKVSIAAGTLSVYSTDDVSILWSATLTTDAAALPVTVVDPG